MSNVIGLETARADRAQREIEILARTIWGEARAEGQAGMQALAALIMNRVRFAKAQPSMDYWWGNSVIRVCLKPLQFSCWNEQNPQLKDVKNVTDIDFAFAIAKRVASWAISGAMGDNTGGATHCHWLNVNPPWATGHAPTSIIGRAVYYKLA